ncbi:hypothetical protein EVAR_100848_1 [Eumeta japonica]|uniref:Uncharacterized protein n=1 Tax=Eumeta variegata TaxID=151549 RepID=A0A4C1T395_EUMVA|nr:hypothetical protein EVAR_100848_1 [Eumeta japonica]
MAQNFDVSLLVQQMAALQATIENMRTEHQKQVQNLEDQISQVQQVQIIPENQRLSPEGKFTKTFGNEQRHQHQQRYQPQPRTELRPRPPLNNFQPRTQQYQSPTTITSRNQWTPVLEIRLTVNQQVPTLLSPTMEKRKRAKWELPK